MGVGLVYAVSQSVSQSVLPPARVVKIRFCHVYECEYEYEYGSVGMTVFWILTPTDTVNGKRYS